MAKLVKKKITKKVSSPESIEEEIVMPRLKGEIKTKEETKTDKVIVNNEKNEVDKLIQNIKNLFFKLCFMGVFGYICFFVIFGAFRNRGIAMFPIINDGDLVLFYRLDKEYHAGDVVVVNIEGRDRVFRIIGTAGDSIYFDETGKIYVNSHLDANKVFYDSIPNFESDVKYPFDVKKNELFVLGDYRIDNNDSRTFGAIKESQIKGKVISVLKTKNL